MHRIIKSTSHSRLRAVMAVLLFVVFILPAAIAGLGFYWYTQQTVVESVQYELLLATSHDAAQIDDWIAERRFDLGVMGRATPITVAARNVVAGSPAASDTLQSLLMRASMFFVGRYTHVVFLDTAGRAHGRWEEVDSVAFQRALSGDAAVAQGLVRQSDSTAALAVYAPVAEEARRPFGVLAATVSINPIYDLLSSSVLVSGQTHLFEHQTQRLASSVSDVIPKWPDAAPPDTLPFPRLFNSAQLYERGSGGHTYMGVGQMMEEIGWTVLVERNRDEALARLSRLREILWSVMVAILIVGGGVAIAVANYTVRRLERREEELRTTHEQLITADRLASVGMMAASMAHEINNPLTTIKVLIHSLNQRSVENEALSSDFSIVLGEIDKIKALVLRFLQFARPRDPEFSNVSLDDILSRIAGLIRHQAQSRGVLIYEFYDESLGKVWADGAQIGQVFLNILLNALDATPVRGEIHVRTSVADGDRACITIWNTGPGLPDEINEQIFEPFFSTKTTGTGLGLSIARTIVEKHSGEIFAEGQGGEGTTFTILLRRSRHTT